MNCHLSPRFWIIVFVFFLMLSPLLVLAENPSVGVEPGDWVQYAVARGGSSSYLSSLYRNAVLVKVTVQEISGTIVELAESGAFNGGVENWIYEWDSSAELHDPENYLIHPNVSIGDCVGTRRLFTKNLTNSVTASLLINGTEKRTYGGVERDAAFLRFTYLTGYFELIVNMTETYVWDVQTGFLLEKTYESRYVGFWTEAATTLTLRIIDTNLWQMSSGATSSSWVSPDLSAAALGTFSTGLAIGLMIMLRAKSSREEKRKGSDMKNGQVL